MKAIHLPKTSMTAQPATFLRPSFQLHVTEGQMSVVVTAQPQTRVAAGVR